VTVAAAFSLRSEVAAFGAPLVGVLIDRFGGRVIVCAGVAGVALGFALLASVQNVPAFYGSIVLIAISTNLCSSQTGTVLVARWFDRNRSRALTLLTIGGGLSGVTVPVLAWAVAAFGWRMALTYSAAATLLCCAPALLFIRDAPSRRDAAAPNATGQPVARPTASVWGESASFSQAVRTRAFWFTALSYAASNFGGTAVFSLAVPGLLQAGISPETAALAAAALPVLSLVGRMGIGMLGDTHDKRRLLAVSFALQAGGLSLLAAPMSEPLLAVFVLLYAVGWGGPIPLRTAIQAEHFGVAALGRIQGLLLFVSSLGGLAGPVVVGTLVDLTGGYRWGFLVACLVVALGVPVALAIPARRVGAPAAG
jgi:MFS family permease